MQIFIAVFLLVVGVVLFLAKGIIRNDDLERAANVGGIVATIAGIIVLAFYTAPLIANTKETSRPPDEIVPLEGFQPGLHSGLTDSSMMGSSRAKGFDPYPQPNFYLFEFWLEPDSFGRVTLDYYFLTLQDWSDYDYVEFTIDFLESKNPCFFYIEGENDGVANGKDPVLLNYDALPVWFDLKNNQPYGTLTKPSVNYLEQQKYLYRISLTDYSSINLKHVRKIGIFIDTSISTGNHKIAIGDIGLVK